MSDDENIGTSAIRAGYSFDQAALARWMDANVAGYRGPLTVEQFKGGQSNPTFKLTAGDQRYVLRTKPGPAAKLLASAHAIDREFRVMDALHTAYCGKRRRSS